MAKKKPEKVVETVREGKTVYLDRDGKEVDPPKGTVKGEK